MLRAIRWSLATILVLSNTLRGEETAMEIIQKAKSAFSNGKVDEAFKLAGAAIAKESKNPQAYLFRANLNEVLRRSKEAIADFDQVLKLDPKAAEIYNRRGSEQFKLGNIKESIADFDRYLALKPAETPKHWKRGISYYYAGQYDEGRKQFEAYEKEDANDVENAVWRYLCMARKDGVKKARDDIMKIGKDRRAWAMSVYDLYSGKAKPEDVLAAAKEGQPSEEELIDRLFYAHLYLGLYHETEGDKKKALEHLALATDKYKIGHYMWDVAKVHLEILRKERK